MKSHVFTPDWISSPFPCAIVPPASRSLAITPVTIDPASWVWDPTYTRGIVRGYLNLDAADIGTSGKVIATDVTVDESNAADFKGAVYRKVKSVITGSSSVTVTPNDGAQTLTLTSSGGSWATPPATPANAVYVWVVNATGTGGDWYQLTGV